MMSDVVAEETGTSRLALLLIAILGGVAVALSGLGVYSVLAFIVAERIGETGIRIALGADKRQIFRIYIRDGLKLAAAGIVVGAIIAFVSGRYVESVLFGVDMLDPASYLGAAVFLAAITFAGTVLPALRAARLDPAVALREQ